MESYEVWQSPFSTRYCSLEMRQLFSDARKFNTWRHLWLALAHAEHSVGIPNVVITPGQLSEMGNHLVLTAEEFALAAQIERNIRHDVVAHVRAFAHTCPLAAPIIHLGATSAYVTDNTDLIVMREGLNLIATGLAKVLDRLGKFARDWHDLPTLAWTHFQAAQPTTVGRRACGWAYELLTNLKDVEAMRDDLLFLGVKGATGTQDSFLHLCGGNHAMVKEIDRLVTNYFGFRQSFLITGQTYSRGQDSKVMDVLVRIAENAHRIANAWRLLQHLKEVEEPFEEEQVGSSAMAYKRNPMRSERICALARYVMALRTAASFTQADQWLERTLDDSACRRLFLAHAFLGIDAVLKLLQNVSEGLVVYPQVVDKHLRAELPFMSTEHIIDIMVQYGFDRQKVHEMIRLHAQAAAARMKIEGGENDFIARLLGDRSFLAIHDQLGDMLQAERFIGRAREQVAEFLTEELNPALEPYRNKLEGKSELKV